MADLDKKIQKTQTDLVQAVLEAQDRKNLERVDTLITTAIKQLKMSRFKPDQTTCLSLTYLAKINPKIFSQSTAIKEVLKSLLRRDTGPTNIKGKNDTILPLLAANILLACCDSSEIRTIILNKLEHWMGTSQKLTELIQHLLATLCMKCHGDQHTINSLIEMRHHWLQYLDDNFEIYGPVPTDLCIAIRNLLEIEIKCESILSYLRFLIKHDTDIEGLSYDVGRLVVERPLSLDCMRKDLDLSNQLNKLILKIFSKLLIHLKSDGTSQNVDTKHTDILKFFGSEVKSEIKSQDEDIKLESTDIPIKTELIKKENSCDNNEDDHSDPKSKVFMNIPNSSKTIALRKSTAEAILTVLSTIQVNADLDEEFNELIGGLTSNHKNSKLATIYEDFQLKITYDMPDRLRQKLLRSPLNQLVDLATRNADIRQLVKLFQQFGSSISTIDEITNKLVSIGDPSLIMSEISNKDFFQHLVEYYSSIGVSRAQELTNLLNQTII